MLRLCRSALDIPEAGFELRDARFRRLTGSNFLAPGGSFLPVGEEIPPGLPVVEPEQALLGAGL